MTREQIFQSCKVALTKSTNLLLEAATGTGKSKISVDLANYLFSSQWYKDRQEINVLILVAKRVHKQTWKEEIEKWGGINHPIAKINIRMECYESMHKCGDRYYDILLCDEIHHIGSDNRLQLLKGIKFGYLLGLSATIPKKLKQLFRFKYRAEVVSCNLTEAIEDDILPEPQILLFPLLLDNRVPTEIWEMHPKALGPIVRAEFKDYKRYKYNTKVHAIISCTQKQKDLMFVEEISSLKNKWETTHRIGLKNVWLQYAGRRLEFLAIAKNQIVSDILDKLKHYRTITFCKTIDQAESLGKNCIHSKNGKANSLYDSFNQKKINHITAVNILNENANLVDCKYAIFANIAASETVQVQRTGRALRHKSPVIIIPYFQGTREEEIVTKMLENFNKDYIKVIHSIQEI